MLKINGILTQVGMSGDSPGPCSISIHLSDVRRRDMILQDSQAFHEGCKRVIVSIDWEEGSDSRPGIHKFLDLLESIHLLELQGKLDSDEAEEIRIESDPIWLSLSMEDRLRARQYNTDLISMSERNPIRWRGENSPDSNKDRSNV